MKFLEKGRERRGYLLAKREHIDVEPVLHGGKDKSVLRCASCEVRCLWEEVIGNATLQHQSNNNNRIG